jgi:hypothetical protein
MNSITTYDSLGRITSTLNLYPGADFDFYAQGQKYIVGYFEAKDYYVLGNQAIRFPEQPSNTVWDWNSKQWVQSSGLAEVEIDIKRKKLLEQSDWTQIPNNPLTAEQQQAWAVYRQELRDITSQSGYPFNVIWPTPPQG